MLTVVWALYPLSPPFLLRRHNDSSSPALPQVYEMSRLNLSYTQLSKRKLLKLVVSKFVRGWDDPRMPTIKVGTVGTTSPMPYYG